jgi:hypothetical protein
MALYAVASARDGYRVMFALAELDPAFTTAEVLLADRCDGKPLAGEEGPFRLMVPKDKKGARSIRMLTQIEIVRAGK